MLRHRKAVFLINLVQDVNILRPLIFMASRDFGLRTLILASTKFCGRDIFGIWRSELDDISSETGAKIEYFNNDWEAYQFLTGEGLIFAASESHLQNHVTTHSVFRCAPASFVRITLQHGLECVGFRHSEDHVRAHGETASFGADIVCSWYGEDRLNSIARSQRAKIIVTGPPAVLQQPTWPAPKDAKRPGIICENLHSVRLNGAKNHKGEFVDAFEEFCARATSGGHEIVLRPHPGGQYVLKNKVDLPEHVRINNAPIYRLDFRRFAYGISAPSSVLIDMVLAGIPTAVWRDKGGSMDADNYAGLATVSSPQEWFDFAQAATADPSLFLDAQDRFLERTGMPLNPQDVYSRIAELFKSAQRMEVRPPNSEPERARTLFIANGDLPTLQLSFELPLAPLVGRGEHTTELLTENDLRGRSIFEDSQLNETRIWSRLDQYQPTLITFCRYSGPGASSVMSWAKREGVPTVYHVDDDLLAIPEDIGDRKFEMHNSQERLAVVRQLLRSVDVVYASTDRLRGRLLEYFPDLNVIDGKIYCSGRVLRRPEVRGGFRMGYMASADHAHNLEMILPAIEQLLERNPHVEFELFGSIPVPKSLFRFNDRIQTSPAVADYTAFLQALAARNWDVGISPLAPIDFNMMKANTKWIEYTSAGIAVVASRGTVYDECCAEGCGVLADSPDEWLFSLEKLLSDDDFRIATVRRAQEKLERDYSIDTLRDQVLDVFELARRTAKTCELVGLE